MAEHYERLKLLFVDDAQYTRFLLREILRGTHWTNAEIVGSAAEAFERIIAEPPDLVFTDWQMPGQSGLDLIRDIRLRPDSPDPLLPVILLTANGDVEHVISAREAGASGYLVKPIALGRITERVVDVVTRQRPFIVSPNYKGPDWRRIDEPADFERRGGDQPASNVIVLPPDGLLLAKVHGDVVAFREAMRRRAEAIAIVKQVTGLTGVDQAQQPSLGGVVA